MNWHKYVPSDPRKVPAWRLKLLKAAQNDRVMQKGLMEACRQDLCFFIDAFCFQSNPSFMPPRVGPFILYPFQKKALKEVLRAVDDREDLRWPKSREMGVSWLVLMLLLWYALFVPRFKGLVISRDIDAVDRTDDPDCLFWKLDFLIEHLPDWMTGGKKRIEGKPVRGKKGCIVRTKMGLFFGRTEASINGEANTAKAGVGGRATVALFDEFGQFDEGQEIYSRTADTCQSRIFVYTHKDAQSFAYVLQYDQKYKDMREVITHWSQHPEKNRGLYKYDDQANRVKVLDTAFEYPPDFNFVMEARPTGGPFPGLRSPWYDKECRRRPARAVAMDLDIDPHGATEQFFDTLVIRALKDQTTCPPFWTGRLLYNDQTGEPGKLLRDAKGLLKLWLNPMADGIPPGRYVGGVDVSAGQGATPTCLSMANVQTGEKVLEYIDANLGPEKAAVLFVALCRLFKDESGNPARLVWECPGHGITFGRKVREINFHNVYTMKNDDVYEWKVKSKNLQPGWYNATKTFMPMLSGYRDALQQKRFINRSWDALDETTHFVYTATSHGVEYHGRKLDEEQASGAKVHHGDIVVADALCYMLVKEAGVERAAAEKEKQLTIFSVEGRRQWNREKERKERMWA